MGHLEDFEITLSENNVYVCKRFDENNNAVGGPAIFYEFRSDRVSDATVKISESVHNTVNAELIGFHPEYGSEFWKMYDEKISFKRTIAGGEAYTTLFGLGAVDRKLVPSFFETPTVFRVLDPVE